MSKFNSTLVRPTHLKTGGLKTALVADTRTFEGGAGFTPDEKTELFKLAVTNFVAQDTFYENARRRDDRFVNLVHKVTQSDPQWVVKFATWLRAGANMRSAAVVVACEYVVASDLVAGGRREIINAVCQRPDEPAEIIGYWFAKYGKHLPMPVKRGLSDACARLYTQKNVLKYDGSNKAIRFADVIRLTHAKPSSPVQSDLYGWLSKSRKNVNVEIPGTLSSISEDYRLQRIAVENRRDHVNDAVAAGWSWERLTSWVGRTDAAVWEAVIPNMGAMALTRNLRNFEQARISANAVKHVQNVLTDPDAIRLSRQFPFRFLSAWKNTSGLTFASALERAVELSTDNIPVLNGKTLVMLDISGSMGAPVSNARGGKELFFLSGAVVGLNRSTVGAVFAAALARKSNCVIVEYNANCRTVTPSVKVGSILRFSDDVNRRVSGSTHTWQCTTEAFNDGKYDRIVILTDEQTADRQVQNFNVPVYTFNLAGYRAAHSTQGVKNSYAFAGFSDSCFQVMSLIESAGKDCWPWEVPATIVVGDDDE